jgi:hypothetical protein
MAYVLTTYPAPYSLTILTNGPATIPQDDTNGDYRAYLAWVAAGNVAEHVTVS